MGFIELFVVLAFGLAWGFVELVGLRIDKRKAEIAAQLADKDAPK